MKVSLVNDGPFTIILDENVFAGKADNKQKPGKIQ